MVTIDIDTNEPIDQAELLEFEWRLTIATRIGCVCSTYFVQRKDVLFPHILAKAAAEDRDSDQVFAEFARGVHQRHIEVFLANLSAAHLQENFDVH